MTVDLTAVFAGLPAALVSALVAVRVRRIHRAVGSPTKENGHGMEMSSVAEKLNSMEDQLVALAAMFTDHTLIDDDRFSELLTEAEKSSTYRHKERADLAGMRAAVIRRIGDQIGVDLSDVLVNEGTAAIDTRLLYELFSRLRAQTPST